jgi:hypothetical protein
VLPLRLEVQVYSGIAPPPEILERMAQARANGMRPAEGAENSAMDEKLKIEERNSSVAGPSSTILPTPIQETAPHTPERPGPHVSQAPPDYSEAPPSYEDAIAVDIPPVDAPRPDYVPPPTGDDHMLRQDEKKGWVDFREV